ncbi:signal peptide plus GPI anchored membrane with N-terminal multiple cysteines [Cryptosporidium sp. chipmunk genotype I]|uniref:signal peptide plus GPI anchored membrane with N-terminal multiple cysteines n=1 Tax=Cryptosporidium sp. chipmunk genotype I TaxID=1280935 RepID=UPI003519D93B|nr:signal peptide plus GPI anchored membrane with N-terminal multiple cysteines [Cryptosporidium sp. chipmunk genotype I]
MGTIFKLICLFSQIYLALASNAKTSQLFGLVPEEQCRNFGCKKVNSVNYYTSCGQSVFCTECHLNAFKPTEHICGGWNLGKFERILLANGSIYSSSKISGNFFEDLNADWGENKPIDLSRCQLENFNYNSAYSAFSTGRYTSLYSTVTFNIAILVNKPKGKTIPPIEFQIDLDETLEEINIRGMNIKTIREKSLCPITHNLNPLKFQQKKTKESMTIISRSFSIPLDRSGVYKPYEFKVKAKCKKKKSCDLKHYKFCLRLSCSRMLESQLAQYKIVQGLLENPPGAVEKQVEEYEDEDFEELGDGKVTENTKSSSNKEMEKDEAEESYKFAEKVQISREVPKKVNAELQLGRKIVFNGNSVNSSQAFFPGNLLYIVSGFAVVIILILLCLLFIRK